MSYQLTRANVQAVVSSGSKKLGPLPSQGQALPLRSSSDLPNTCGTERARSSCSIAEKVWHQIKYGNMFHAANSCQPRCRSVGSIVVDLPGREEKVGEMKLKFWNIFRPF